MFALVYMYRDNFFMPRLIPGICFYGFTHDIPLKSMTEEQAASYIEGGGFDEDYTYSIYGPKRIPEFDGPDTVQNRYAYAHIFMCPVKPKNRLDAWMYFTASLRILDFMKHEGGISDEVLITLEKVIWSTCDISKHVLRMYKKLLSHMISKIADKVYDPDYVWSTGRRKGMTTLEAMRPVFEEHAMLAS